MFETHTSLTYDEAFDRAHKARAEAFRAMFGFVRMPWPSFGRKTANA